MKALVTGGGGFLGGAIVRRLLARGDTVVSLARGEYPELEALGVEHHRRDLAEAGDLADLMRGVDVVFHVAAKAGMWGPREEYRRANLVATQRVVAAAAEAGVGRLVYTSSPSVVFHGHDEEGVSEADCTYPERFPFHYPETKAAAEQHALAASTDRLRITALRPHLIYGPGDPHLLPRLIARHRAGRLRVLGDGQNKVALTYVDNAAEAHLLAADALATTGAPAGKAYFITDGEPVKVWDWLGEVFAGVGLGPIPGPVPRGLALFAGTVAETVWRVFGLSGEPPVTRFTVEQVTSSHWYDLSAARRDLGYATVVDPAEGQRRTIASLRRA